MDPDLAAELEQINTTLTYILGFTNAIAIAAALGIGLLLWRLIVLAKNQRHLF